MEVELESQSMAVFNGDPWRDRVQHNLLFKMVPSVSDESARIVGTLFYTKATNFASSSEPNKALF